MASANQVKALLQSHIDGDDTQFYSVAMQMAAKEAKLGHGNIAKEFRDLIDQAKQSGIKNRGANAVPMARPTGELSGLLSVAYSKQRLSNMVLSSSVKLRMERLLTEHRQVQKIRAHGLSPRKKLLLIGPPGTGKTLTASALAGELGLPLFVIHLDGLMAKHMGETAAKLRVVFDAITKTRGVYLFDEFDSIGSQRGMANDVGEMRRVLNSFLQMMEQDCSDSFLVAATNHSEMLDKALFRRFDDVIEYALPNKKNIMQTLKAKLASFKQEEISWQLASEAAEGLSYADITKACEDAMKHSIINETDGVSEEELVKALNERRISDII